MKKCKYCNVTVDTDKNFCPLCFNKLDDLNDNSNSLYSMRTQDEVAKKSSKLLLKIFVFLSIISIVASVVVNFYTTPHIWWSSLVIIGELYIWVLIKHTILSKRSIFAKFLLQILCIILILYLAEKLSFSHWLLPYAFPSASLLTLAIMAFISIFNKERGEHLFGFLVIVFCLGITSLVVLLLNIYEFSILNTVNLTVCVLFLFAIILFGFNAIKTELLKKWHI